MNFFRINSLSLWTSYALRVLLSALLASATTAWAGVSYESVRQFEGTSYLALSTLKVYQRPATDSLIVADVPRWRMVYATPDAVPGWAAIKGAGSRAYPDTYTGNKGDKVGLKNGKLNLMKDRLDRDDYYPLLGYVELSRLGNLDQSNPLPIKTSMLRRLPSPWRELGVEERRFLPVDPASYPFASVPVVQVFKSSGEKPICTGFVIEAPYLVGTAGHCFDGDEKRILVKFTGNGVPIEATLLGKKYVDVSLNRLRDDWALLRLSRIPEFPVRPIKLPSAGAWLKAGRFEVLQLGFGGDLEFIKQKLLGEQGLWTVHGDRCTMIGSTFTAYRSDGNIVALSTRGGGADCIGTPGDSGGPILFWHAEQKEYEVLGIRSYGDHSVNHLRMAFEADALTAYDRLGNSITKEWNGSIKVPPPASAAVAKEVGKSIGYYFEQDGWYLDRDFVSLVLRESGSHKTAEEILSIFNADGIAPRTVNLSGSIENAAEQQLMKALSTASSLKDSDFFKYRELFYNADHPGSLMNRLHQIKLGLGEVLKLDALRKDGVPFQNYIYLKAFWPSDKDKGIYAGPQYFLVKEDAFKEESMIGWARRNGMPQDSLDDLLGHTRDMRLVVAGGDAFFVERNTGLITNIERNFMNIISGDVEASRRGKRYPLAVEDPANDRLQKIGSSVPPSTMLRSADFGAETPATIPGGKLIDIRVVWRRILAGLQGKGKPPLVLAAIQNREGVPTARNVSFASNGGDFRDENQSKLAAVMSKLEPDKNREIVVYCHHNQCWLAYNAALRLIALGYKNVQWMRDGIDGWIETGLPLMRVGQL